MTRRGVSAALLVALMFLGSLGLWIGVPVGWFWVGGRVQGLTHSLGAAVLVVLGGVIASIFALLPALGWLNHKYAQTRAARGLDDYGSVTLEGVLVVSAVLALAAFGVWFFVLSGAEPIPLGLPK
jgi:hypothetical protein